MFRLRFLAPVVVLGLMTGGWLMGDDKKPDAKDPPPPIRGSLPANFKKLGLSEEQRREVLRVRANYAAKIDALKQQIAELQKQQRIDEEKVLTDAQRARLKEIRSGDSGKDKAPLVDKPAANDKDKDKK